VENFYRENASLEYAMIYSEPLDCRDGEIDLTDVSAGDPIGDFVMKAALAHFATGAPVNFAEIEREIVSAESPLFAKVASGPKQGLPVSKGSQHALEKRSSPRSSSRRTIWLERTTINGEPAVESYDHLGQCIGTRFLTPEEAAV
jgi:hypothetical protein